MLNGGQTALHVRGQQGLVQLRPARLQTADLCKLANRKTCTLGRAPGAEAGQTVESSQSLRGAQGPAMQLACCGMR